MSNINNIAQKNAVATLKIPELQQGLKKGTLVMFISVFTTVHS